MAVSNNILQFFLLVNLPWLAKSENKGAVEKLIDGYDRATRPNADTSTPVKVELSLAFEHVKWHNSLLSISVYFRQKWNDPRFVRKSGITRLNSEHTVGHIWDPDAFFMNAWTPPTLVQNGFTYIEHNGDVLYSKQLQFQVYCPINVTHSYWHNGDVKCEIDIASYTYNASDLVYHWADEPSFSGRFQNVSSVKTSINDAKYSVGVWSAAKLELYVQTVYNRPAIDYRDTVEFDIQ
jgi:hypothetical protein